MGGFSYSGRGLGWRSKLSLLALVVPPAVAPLVACAPSPLVKTARSGELAPLRSQIVAAEAAGKLDTSETLKIAKAIAGREIATAKSHQADARIMSLRPCALPLADALVERAESGFDDSAATAELLLIETGLLNPKGLTERYAKSKSPAWRMLAARGAVTDDSIPLRAQFYRDPDPEVRRAALRAALKKPSGPELQELLEVARLDPDELNRSLAARAVGRIGGQAAVIGLKDLWARADETGRLALVAGLSAPNAFSAGGAAELRRLVESGPSLPGVAAAAVLVQRGDPEQRGIALSVLRAAILKGDEKEQKAALRVAPLSDSEILAAVIETSKSPDSLVRVAALSRLTTVKNKRKEALTALLALADGGEDAAAEARSALASAGDGRVAPALVKQLEAPTPQARQRAALDLIRLGEIPRAAVELTDPDVNVRLRIACSMLAAD
jgi:hypothetical protein